MPDIRVVAVDSAIEPVMPTLAAVVRSDVDVVNVPHLERYAAEPLLLKVREEWHQLARRSIS